MFKTSYIVYFHQKKAILSHKKALFNSLMCFILFSIFYNTLC